MSVSCGSGRWRATGHSVALLGLLTGVVAASLGAAAAGDGTTEAAPGRHPFEIDRFQTVRPGEYTDYNQRLRLIGRGLEVYRQECIGCHGVKGDGNGLAAERLLVKPRNFTAGVFKFRSTRQLQLPLEADLHRTITKGLPGVSMPAYPLMPEQDKVAVIEYVKTFVPDWDKHAAEREVVYVPRAPQDLMTEDRFQRGRVVYLTMQCGRCHGMDGAGTRAAIGYVEDPALGSIRPRNFTRGRFRGGMAPEDIYRTFHTGLGGAMPKFDESVILYANQQTLATQGDFMYPGEAQKLEAAASQFPATPADVFKLSDARKVQVVRRNSWDLVAYVLSLTREPKPTAPPPVVTAPQAAGAATSGGKAAEGGDDYGD